MLTILLVVVLVVLLCGGAFTWGPGYRHAHGPAVGGVVGLLLLVVVIVLVLQLVGHLAL